MMHWSHLGDSRTYLFRHGRAHWRTLDHTRVEAMRLSGEIEDSDSQSTASGRSGVWRCLGGAKKVDDIEIEITPAISLQEGDTLLLCTDGVWSQIKEMELESIMLEEDLSLQERLYNLVNLAVKSGHPHSDNATALALCWHSENEAENQVTTAAPTNDRTPRSTTTQTDTVDSALDHLRDLINKYQ
jgi:serine/threonine protein phosphatase PrpC